MISPENKVFDSLSTYIASKYENVTVSSDYLVTSTSFPCVTVSEEDNSVVKSMISSSGTENLVSLMYEINVYSNKTTGKKAECKKIASTIDEHMTSLGFVRTTMMPTANFADNTVYRITMRYTGYCDNNFHIFQKER